MKDKFSIFSPPSNKTASYTNDINFKKSPNKFAVYEQMLKPKESSKFSGSHGPSSPNL